MAVAPNAKKFLGLTNMKGSNGMNLRGKPVYKGGASVPNPVGALAKPAFRKDILLRRIKK